MSKRNYDTVKRMTTEKVDSTPVKTEVKLSGPSALETRILRILQSERFARYQESQGLETFEDSQDFDVADDLHPYEPEFDDELVYDPTLKREITRKESRSLEDDRKYANEVAEAVKKRAYRLRKASRQRVKSKMKGDGATPSKQTLPEQEA